MTNDEAMLKKKKIKDVAGESLKKEEQSEEVVVLKTAEEQAEEYLNGWKRCQAEFENYKKSKMNLERDMAGRAVEDFAYRLLPVVDNFHSSTDHIPEDQKDGSWVQGIMYIQKQLEQVLQEMGIEEIAVAEGDVFDPAIHEAVQGADRGTQSAEHGDGKDIEERRGEVLSPDAGSDKENTEERRCEVLSPDAGNVGAKDFSPKHETIKKVLMRGYRRGERVIRPARVIIQ